MGSDRYMEERMFRESGEESRQLREEIATLKRQLADLEAAANDEKAVAHAWRNKYEEAVKKIETIEKVARETKQSLEKKLEITTSALQEQVDLLDDEENEMEDDETVIALLTDIAFEALAKIAKG